MRFFAFLLKNFAFLGIWNYFGVKPKNVPVNLSRFTLDLLCKKDKIMRDRRKLIGKRERERTFFTVYNNRREKSRFLCCSPKMFTGTEGVLGVKRKQNPRNAKNHSGKRKKTPWRFYYNRTSKAKVASPVVRRCQESESNSNCAKGAYL